MSTHDFSFNGGEILSKMGASWFVSYAYHKYIDSSHTNWSRVSTTQSRISKFNTSKEYHKYWLEQVLVMNSSNLSKNTIGLSSIQTKSMAQDFFIISRFSLFVNPNHQKN